MKRYIGRTCTNKEREELAGWISQFRDDEQLTQFLEKIWADYEPVDKMASERANAILSSILLSQVEQKQEPAVFPVKTATFLWRMIAAASVILLLSLVAYLLSNNKSGPETAKMESREREVKNDVAPGGYKAILTLGNGSKIVLDSAGNGMLASQGNSRIMKLANGQIAYSSSGDLSDGSGSSAKAIFNTLTTPAGGQYELVLPDGSRVWLDASSSITYPAAFIGSQRKVEITGQAYFEVKKNEMLPFVVQAGAESIQVLGTHFNVNAYEDEMAVKTTLLEGSVKIVKGATRTIISPGQQMQVFKNGEVRLINNFDVEEAIAWKSGFFSFNKSDLKTVMRQLSRWYNVQIIYQGNIPPKQF
ncbi:MAG: FecR domain-containing protein, partial [Ferruginibacter sp.]